MKRIISAGLVLFAMAALPAVAGKKTPDGDATHPAKPALHLKASTRNGYSPLEVTLTGNLLGADPADLDSCLLSEEWTGDTPVSGLKPNTKKTIPCVTALEDGHVPRSFERKLTLNEPGTYSYRILLTPKGQRTIASQSIEVRAVRSQFGIGTARTGS
jgi:hypothetical protein